MMNQTLFLGILVALGSGIAIGIQSTLFTVIGRMIGPVHASLILNFIGGILATVIIGMAMGVQHRISWNIPVNTLVAATIAVSMGLAIVVGVAFSFQQVGVAAGTATLFFGQMLIGIMVDSRGMAGGDAIPLDQRRIMGLAVMVIAIVLLSTRQVKA